MGEPPNKASKRLRGSRRLPRNAGVLRTVRIGPGSRDERDERGPRSRKSPLRAGAARWDRPVEENTNMRVDEQAIQKLADDLGDAWNRHDMKAHPR